jgi:hypothetical protein
VTIKTLSTRLVYENPWVRVREDAIEREDGSPGVYAVVDKNEGSLVIPWDGERVHLVGQVKYPVGAFYWEFPQGAIGRRAEETRGPSSPRRRLRAGRLAPRPARHRASGCRTRLHVWLATELEPARRPRRGGRHGPRGVTPRESTQVRSARARRRRTIAAWSSAGGGRAVSLRAISPLDGRYAGQVPASADHVGVGLIRRRVQVEVEWLLVLAALATPAARSVTRASTTRPPTRSRRSSSARTTTSRRSSTSCATGSPTTSASSCTTG